MLNPFLDAETQVPLGVIVDNTVHLDDAKLRTYQIFSNIRSLKNKDNYLLGLGALNKIMSVDDVKLLNKYYSLAFNKPEFKTPRFIVFESKEDCEDALVLIDLISNNSIELLNYIDFLKQGD